MVMTEGKPVVLVFRYMRYLHGQFIKLANRDRKEVLPCILSLVCSDDRQQIIAFKKVTRSLVSVREG
jgi:hypothetical protein